MTPRVAHGNAQAIEEDPMEIDKDQVRVLCEIQGLSVPDDELDDIATRMSTWLAALAQIEAELGDEMNRVDPIPPLFPADDRDL